jgi:hypothetical protein
VRRLRAPSLESLFVAALVLFGFRLGALPIGDNSMLTHLRTGLDMVSGHGIPRTDPYSYTAHGTKWVVQSWLPEWTYGWLHRLGGFRLVVLEQAALLAVLAWLIARLARSGTPLRTVLAAGLAIGIGAPFWSPRPLLFGLLCMALTVTVVERRRTPWLLVPIVWLWVNSHGSFPLGGVWLVARGAGEWLDWKAWPRETVRYVWAFLGGLVVSVLNPLGAKLLFFPLNIAGKSEVFNRVVEWQSPDFHRTGDRFALVLLAVGLALLFRARLTWRDSVPAMVFLVLSLYAVRNFPIFAIALAPVLQRILRRPEGAAPRKAPTESQLRVNRALLATITLGFVVFGALAVVGDSLDLKGFPVVAADYLDTHGLLDQPHRLAHQDSVGNYLEFRFGRRVGVFIDDRVDMYPLRVSRDYVDLLSAKPDALTVLARNGVDVVLWERTLPLTQVLQASGAWRQLYDDGTWVVFEKA